MFIRVLVSFLFIFMGTGIGLGMLHAYKNPEPPEEYVRVLEDHMSVETKESELSLRKQAYEVEVTEEELNDIKEYYEETNFYHYYSYRNFRLFHFYSVILNRYIPDVTYRDTSVLLEYVFDGLLETRDLSDEVSSNPNIDTWNEELLLKILWNDEDKEHLKQEEMEKVLHRFVDDYLKYANSDVKENVYFWVLNGPPFEVSNEESVTWETFKVIYLEKMNQLEEF